MPLAVWAILGALALLGLGLAVWGFLIEPRLLDVTANDVALEKLDPRLDGLLIAHLSDFHLGDFIRPDFVRKVVRVTNEIEADLIVITGDFVSAAHGGEPLIAELASLRAKHGVFACLGNHDYYGNDRQVVRALAETPIRLLRDEAVRLEINGAPLWIAGTQSVGVSQYTEDPERIQYVSDRLREFLARSLETVDRHEPVIVLSHIPDVIYDAAEMGVDLLLCGHTHGGQVRFPFIGAVRVPSRYGTRFAAGWFREGPTQMFVTRGLGTVRLPVRFMCSPELPVIRLRVPINAPPRSPEVERRVRDEA
jgi:uncharacterized protein